MKTNVTRKYISLTLVVCFTSSNFIFSSPAEVWNNLGNSFSGPCSAHGFLTSQAKALATDTAVILNSIKSSAACATSVKNINAIQAGIAKMKELSEHNNEQENISDLQAALESELLKKKKNDPSFDQNYANALKNNLMKIKAVYLSKKIKNSSEYKTKNKDIVDFVAQSSAFVSAVTTNADCAAKVEPSVLVNIGNTLSATGNTNIYSGLAGTILTGVGATIDGIMTYVKQRPFTKNISDPLGELPFASIGCALETAASVYCKARDVQNIIGSLPTESTSCTLESGVSLIHQKNVFEDFINNLSISLNKNVDANLSFLNAIRADSFELLDSAKKNKNMGFSEKFDLAQKLVKKADLLLNDNSKMNILSPLFAADKTCGPVTNLLTGGENSDCIKNNSENCAACVKALIKNKEITVDSIEKSFNKLLNTAHEKIQQNGLNSLEEKNNEVIEAVAQLGASSPSLEKNQIENAKEYLTQTHAYLEQIKSDPDIKDSITVKLLASRLDDQIQSVVNEINAIDFGNANQVNKIIDLANHMIEKLSPKTNYLSNNLAQITDTYLAAKVRKGQMDNASAAFLTKQMGEDIPALLGSTNGLEGVRQQVDASKRMAQNNMAFLYDMFSKHMVDSLGYLNAASMKEKQEGPNRGPYTEAISLFCAQSLLRPTDDLYINDSKPKKDLKANQGTIDAICKGKMYWSKFEKRGLQLDYDSLRKLPFEQRVCSVYDFFRKSRLNSIDSKLVQ